MEEAGASFLEPTCSSESVVELAILLESLQKISPMMDYGDGNATALTRCLTRVNLKLTVFLAVIERPSLVYGEGR